MALLTQEEIKMAEQKERLYRELDKGIDDMEQGRIVPHDEAMQLIRERIKSYRI